MGAVLKEIREIVMQKIAFDFVEFFYFKWKDKRQKEKKNK